MMGFFAIITVIGVIIAYIGADKEDVVITIMGIICFAVGMIVLIWCPDEPTEIEIQAKQVQIDTMYTTLSGKTDTTYIIKYLK